MSDQRQSSNRIRAKRRQPITFESLVSSSSANREDQARVDSNNRKINASIALPKHATSSHNEVLKIPSGSRQPTSRKRNHIESSRDQNLDAKKSKESVSDSDEDEVIIVPAEVAKKTTDTDVCPICLDVVTKPKELSKCGHVFCQDCIEQCFRTVKPQCPCCSTIYGEIRGNQPLDGRMDWTTTRHRLPGYESDSRGTIRINYYFPDGIQDESHTNPGQPYHGTSRTAYLPDNEEGRHVLALLGRAFELRQIFTVGQSRTTGYDNVITWNDIHHKTNYNGGVENFGYPDPTYLNRVKQELAAKGII